MSSKVVLVPCKDYDENRVYLAMKVGIEALGGIGAFVQKDEKILVKPNFLTASDADAACVTHPAVIRGMLRLLNEAGYGNVKFGDSPGHGSCRAAAERIGLTPDRCYGAELADMSEECLTQFPEGMTCKEFYFTREITEADAIINLCKMKTHALERLTGAVKNVYGFICGYRKAAGHVKFPNASVFARMLCDIHRCTKPRLHIMDGITAMEGNGPGSGTPTHMGLMLFSADPVALDAVFCRLVDLDPELVPTNVQGMNMGIGSYRMFDIEIYVCSAEGVENAAAGAASAGNAAAGSANEENAAAGAASAETAAGAENAAAAGKAGQPAATRRVTADELFREYGNPSFDVPRNKPRKSFLSGYSGFMTKFARRPFIQADQCVKCGVCVSHCPVPGKAVNFTKGRDHIPVYDYSKCIRCYCCQEMCPKHAIHVRGK